MTDRLDRAMSLSVAVSAVCLLVSWCAPPSARAEDCQRYAAVAQGTPSPCDGVIMSPGEAARFLLLEDERDRLRVELDAERKQHALTRDEGAELLRVCEQSRRACEEQQAPPPVARAWWDSPWVGAVVGVVVSVVVTVGVVAAVR